MSFGARDSGVDEVALQHDAVARIENDNDGGVFAALALVDGAGVGEHEFFDFVGFVIDGLVIVKDGDFF